MIIVQKIQQNTILKNSFESMADWYKFKKYNKIQSLRTEHGHILGLITFKKYNKIQSLRTKRRNPTRKPGSKNTTKYNP